MQVNVGGVPGQETTIVVQATVPRVICELTAGTPKIRTVTLIDERTIVVTITHREGIKTTAVI